jgi:hypothetical protein
VLAIPPHFQVFGLDYFVNRTAPPRVHRLWKPRVRRAAALNEFGAEYQRVHAVFQKWRGGAQPLHYLTEELSIKVNPFKT